VGKEKNALQGSYQLPSVAADVLATCVSERGPAPRLAPPQPPQRDQALYEVDDSRDNVRMGGGLRARYPAMLCSVLSRRLDALSSEGGSCCNEMPENGTEAIAAGALDVPGREQDLARLTAACDAVVQASGPGRTLFVAGGDGSGRHELLRAVARRAAQAHGRPTVIAGGFVDGKFVPSNIDGVVPKVVHAVERHGSKLELFAASMGATGNPIAALLAVVVAASNLSVDVLGRIGQGHHGGVLEVAPHVLREACEKRPIVCVIDDADRAEIGGLWADLVLGFAKEVQRELPLVLILGLDGPEVLGGHDTDEPDSLNVARQLVEAELASWYPLSPVGVGDLLDWTGPVVPTVLSALHEITRGRAGWAAALWHDWQRMGRVGEDPSGRWDFTTDRQHLQDAGLYLRENLKRLMVTEDLDALAQGLRVLEWAALEGQRFTPAAVAGTLQRDPEEIVDFLDDYVISDDTHRDGLVVDCGWVTVNDEAGRRSVAVYRFVRDLDWLTLRYHGVTEAEQRNQGSRLADELGRVYGGESYRIARTLARLYDVSQQPKSARHYRQMADLGLNRAIALERARGVLSRSDPDDPAERERAYQTLMVAARAMQGGRPYAEAIKIGETACRMASRPGDEAVALLMTGVPRFRHGEKKRGEEDVDMAATMWHELGDVRSEATALGALANIEQLQAETDRDLSAAYARMSRALELYEEVGDPLDQAMTLAGLAQIDRKRRAFGPALEKLQRAVRLLEAVAVPRGREQIACKYESSVRLVLGATYIDTRQYKTAREELTRALVLTREVGEHTGEGDCRRWLAYIEFLTGNPRGAREAAMGLLTFHRAVGDTAGEIETQKMLRDLWPREPPPQPRR
jgi:tetratricopeptide (TPR) repeat protein